MGSSRAVQLPALVFPPPRRKFTPMPETRRIPYLSTETPIEIPNDLPIPSTTRALQPRSRATSLARSEARSASASRPGSRRGSRAGSPGSRASSSSRSRMADPVLLADDEWMDLGGNNELEMGADSTKRAEAVNDALEQEPIAGPSTIPVQADAGGIPIDEDIASDVSPAVAPSMADVPTSEMEITGDEIPPSLQASSSTSDAKREDESSGDAPIPHSVDDSVAPSLPSWETTEWQADGLEGDFGDPIRLGLGFGGPSASSIPSDVTGSKRKRSPASSSPEEPLSQRSWRTDLEAEGEVADQLLLDDGSDVPLSQLSSASSPKSPEKSKKGKGKERAKTPDPTSVIVIPDTPPTTHKQFLPPRPPQPEPLSSYTCPICFSQPTNATLTPCGHICCGACLFAAVKTTIQRAALAHVGPVFNEARCPVCRATIPGWDGKGGGVIGLKARAIFRL